MALSSALQDMAIRYRTAQNHYLQRKINCLYVTETLLPKKTTLLNCEAVLKKLTCFQR